MHRRQGAMQLRGFRVLQPGKSARPKVIQTNPDHVWPKREADNDKGDDVLRHLCNKTRLHRINTTHGDFWRRCQPVSKIVSSRLSLSCSIPVVTTTTCDNIS